LPETALQVPSEPETSQASHWPLQAASQQKPSAQAVAQSARAEHFAPTALTHVPATGPALAPAQNCAPGQLETKQQTFLPLSLGTQVSPAMQSDPTTHSAPAVPVLRHLPVATLQLKPAAHWLGPATVQAVTQVPEAPHAYEPQSIGVVDEQAPAALQNAPGLSVPDAQVAALQSTDVPGVVHAVAEVPSHFGLQVAVP
jgi:hypothetical protein